MSNVKISIIVPIYNSEKFLKKCLNSLVNQTMQEIEIICVNDGSTDDSSRILKEYSDIDKRVIIINQENSGVSQARNNAIKIAKGKFLLFIDSDDWLDVDACQIVYNIAKQYEVDVVMFACVLEYANKTLYKYAFDEELIIYNNEECEILHRRHSGMINEELLYPEKQDYLCSSCTKLYKRDIIVDNNILFKDLSEIGSYEDGLFNLYYFNYVRHAVYINNSLYHYRKDNESSNTSSYKPNLTDCWNNLFNIMESYIHDNKLNYKFKLGLQNRIALSAIGLGLNVIISDKDVINKIKEIKHIISTERYKKAVRQLEIKHMPIHWKVFFLYAKMNFSFGLYILLMIMNKLRGKV